MPPGGEVDFGEMGPPSKTGECDEFIDAVVEAASIVGERLLIDIFFRGEMSAFGESDGPSDFRFWCWLITWSFRLAFSIKRLLISLGALPRLMGIDTERPRFISGGLPSGGGGGGVVGC